MRKEVSYFNEKKFIYTMQIDHLGYLRFDYFFMHVIKMVVMIDRLDI